MLNHNKLKLIISWFVYVKPINPCTGDNGTKTLRQLQAEEDDEERFQADLKKAVRQSLGKEILSPFICCYYILSVYMVMTRHHLDGL